MTARGLATLVRTVRRLGEAGANISDAELLGRFSRRRDETAFAALVGRHGPMVLGVCHRVLRDLQAAEDAFQATFLVLAGKARTLRRPEALGSFLHGVAYRTALRARTDAVKRRLHESRAVTSVVVEPDDDPAWRELRLLLDGAIDRLPEVYRVPFVLCYLQDKTNAEAARQLGCSRGTIATRLARARKILRTRLARLAPEFSPALFAGPALPNALRPMMLRTARMVVALTAGFLSNLRIDQKEALDGDQEVTGSVTYRTLTPTAGKLAVRLTFMLGTSTRTHYWKLLENERLAGQGVLPFAFTALYSDQNRAIGSTILFVDVCSLNDSNSKAKDLVLSNTVAELVTIHDTKTQTDK